MNKRSFVIYAFAFIAIVGMCSYHSGAASHGWDCTGGETGLGNSAGCGSGGGCHSTSATPGIVVSLELDSAGVPVTGYKPGLTYKVTIRGVNTTSSSLPRFGFQVAAFKGSASQVTPVNVGTLQATGLPTGVHYQTPVNLTYTVANILEQSTAIAADSGTGGTGTLYKESFTWVAPVAGTGTVSFWGVINAVNFNGNQDGGDLWNTDSLVIHEDTTVVVNGVRELQGNMEVNVYPNPATDHLHIELSNAISGAYELSVFDAAGREIMKQNEHISSGSSTVVVNTSNWSQGIYFVKVSKDGIQKVEKIVKP